MNSRNCPTVSLAVTSVGISLSKLQPISLAVVYYRIIGLLILEKIHTLHTFIQAECNNVQPFLKRKKILSEHTLSTVVTFKANGLHESIPSALPEPSKIRDGVNYYRLMY